MDHLPRALKSTFTSPASDPALSSKMTTRSVDFPLAVILPWNAASFVPSTGFNFSNFAALVKASRGT
jgi:hypothetical protein